MKNMNNMDCGPNLSILNVKQAAKDNNKFRVAGWTGGCVQADIDIKRLMVGSAWYYLPF